MTFNKVILIGRLTADPELKTTQNGVAVCSFTLAVDRKYKSGEERQTDFLSIVTWRQTAEFVSKYFHRGDGMIAVGEIRTRTYEKDGRKQYITEIVAESVDFGERRQNTEEAAPKSKFENLSPEEDLPF